MHLNGTLIAEERKKKLAGDISLWLMEEMEIELSPFRSEMLLEFLAAKLAPEIYNNAVLDCRAFLSGQLEEMETLLFVPEGQSN